MLCASLVAQYSHARWGGVGVGGRLGAEGGLKHPFGPKGQSCAFSKCHELIQTTREAQTAVRSSLVPHAVLLTHPRGFTASAKSCL